MRADCLEKPQRVFILPFVRLFLHIFSSSTADKDMITNSTVDRFIIFLFLALFFSWPTNSIAAEEKIIIGANGAGGELIEHTLPAVTLAATEGIDYIELHVVMTSDNQLIVFHDLTLNRLTDAVELFPGRSRENGGYYVIDFSLKEIRQMRLKGASVADNPSISLAIPTLREELSLIRRLESILKKSIGISLEIGDPAFHTDSDRDISSASLEILMDYGYIDTSSKLFIQSFDPEELQRIHSQLMPQKEMHLPLIQLIGSNEDLSTQEDNFKNSTPYSYDWLYSNSGLKILSSYAAAIGLPADTIVDSEGNPLLTDYINTAHDYGMAVFAYSLNNQSADFPLFADSFRSLLDVYLQKAGIDGFYTDAFGEAKIISDDFLSPVPAPEEKKDYNIN